MALSQQTSLHLPIQEQYKQRTLVGLLARASNILEIRQSQRLIQPAKRVLLLVQAAVRLEGGIPIFGLSLSFLGKGA